MQRVIKIVGIIFAEIILMLGCISLGIFMSDTKEEKLLLTINKIALVNLDDGVEINGVRKYYGTEFIRDLDDDFEITSLEQARRGLENDLYAAYVIIPATFSKNVESVNSDLIKSNITYKTNPNLDYTIREEVITDIWMFNDSLSTNIEYVYVDAILKGVHAVQDGADELLENDLKDLQAVLQFTETDLIVDPEYPDEKHVDSNVEKLDISDIYASIQTVFSDLSTEYKASQTSAQQEYDKLIEDMTSVSTKMGELNAEIGDVAYIDKGEEFNIENDEEIASYIDGYNTNLTTWKWDYDQQAISNFDGYLNKCQTHTNEQLEELNTSHKDYLKEYYSSAYEECDFIVTTESDTESENESENDFRIDVEQLEVYKVALGIINKLESEISELQSVIDNMEGSSGSLEGEIVKENPTKESDPKQPTYEDILCGALESDIPIVKEAGQRERNKALRNAITTWLKADLIHYGAPKKDIEELTLAEMDGQKAAELIDDWYETKVELSIEPAEEQESTEEDGTTEDDTSQEEVTTENSTTEDVPDNEQDDSEKKNESEESDENEKTEQEIKLEKRAKVLFAGTYEPSPVDIETLDSLISGAVIGPIRGSIMQKYSELATSYSALNTVWTNWGTKLNGFTVNSYGNDEKRKVIEKTFNENMKKIQTVVNNKGTEYETYVTQANEANNDNLEAWKTSIENANKETRTNVDNSIKNIKTTREQMNISNNNLMTNISNVLPYSRIGELENRNVYSYITSPIVQEDLSGDRLVDNVESKDNTPKNIVDDNRREMVILAFGIILCVIGGGILIKQIKKRNKYLQRQDL